MRPDEPTTPTGRALLAGSKREHASPSWRVQGDLPALVVAIENEARRLLLADRDRHRGALEDMVIQFAHWSESAGGYWTGGLSALEWAFDVLGWDDPHPAPESRCDEPGCMRQVTCGWPTRPGGTGPNGGYRRTCGDHMRSGLAALAAAAPQEAPDAT